MTHLDALDGPNSSEACYLTSGLAGVRGDVEVKLNSKGLGQSVDVGPVVKAPHELGDSQVARGRMNMKVETTLIYLDVRASSK